MRLDQLRQLTTIAAYRSISKSAEVLHISQPALSASLRSMEKELGLELYKRTNKGILLTADGEHIHREALAILKTMENWCAAKKQAGNLEGEIHIICSLAVSHHLTPNIIVPFQKLYPKVTVFVKTTNHLNILENLRNTRSNIAVASLAPETTILQDASAMGLSCHHLYSDERRIFLGANHPFAAKENLTIRDLSLLPLAWYSDFKDVVSRNFAPYFASSYRLANKEDILSLVIANEAAFIQPYHLFRNDFRVKDGLLVSRRVPDEVHQDCKAEIIALFRPELSERENQFLKYLVNHFSDSLGE